MSDCCQTEKNSTAVAAKSNKYPCPKCMQNGADVSITTIMHHVISPWILKPSSQNYYFCNNHNCSVVYYAADDSTITQQQLRTVVAQKQQGAERLLCYCYGVTVADATANAAVKQFVIAQTRQGNCSCESRNPSGRCCLKDFQ